MAWTYRTRIKIIPGVRLNISKRGISTTIGVKGASVNIGPNGTYLNTGIPALGMYNRRKISSGNDTIPESGAPDIVVTHPSPSGNIFVCYQMR